MGLTTKKIEKLKARGRYGDGGCLYLEITSTGVKSWTFRYARGGRERSMGLGPVRDVTLAEAREKAHAARRLLRDGVDPLEARRADRDAHRAETIANITFKQATEEYLGLYDNTWRNAKHRRQWKTTLETYAYPKLGARPVKAIDAAVINDAVAPLWAKTPETARRVKQRIERVLRWVSEGKPLPKPHTNKHARHHAALPYPQLPAFMANLREREGTGARALEFLILTAARTGEVIGAQWPEIDFDARAWTIPGNRMKAGRPHTVPLSDRAIELLETLPREDDNSLVFVGPKRGGGLSNMAMAAVLRRMNRDDITVHGFRSTFKDWASEMTNHPNIVSEMALAHTIGNAVERAYRRGDLLLKRKKLMADWARYCSSEPTAQRESVLVSLRRVAA